MWKVSLRHCLLRGWGALAATLSVSTIARAAEGQPAEWQIGFQAPATAIMQQITDFHDLLLVIVTAITVFVLGLLLWVVLRYNDRANPEPTTKSHNTALEVLWTVVPVLILIVIAIPSFRLLYGQYDAPKADVTIKATGHQWYWSYEYPDHGNFAFDALMVEDDDLQPGQPRLLATDNDIVVPVGKVVHLLLTASDVIHSWTVPAFGVKMDAVPGRTTRVWFKAEKTGMYYGQCSELCGSRHAFMPIAVRVVSESDYQAWLQQARQEFAARDAAPAADRLAAAR